MKEIFFMISEEQDGSFTARAIGHSIFTEADDVDTIKLNIKEAMLCHFEDISEMPKVAHLHFVKDEIMDLV